MRTSRTAILSCAALLGLGTLISQAAPAFAGPTPPMVVTHGGSNVDTGDLDWKAPPTTTKPTIPEMDLVLPEADEPEFTPPIAVPGDEDVVGDPASAAIPDCNPLTPSCVPDDDCQPVPGGPDCPPEDDCVPVPGGPDCPKDECVPDSTVPGTPDEQCPKEDPCRPTPSAATTAQTPPDEDCCPTGPIFAQTHPTDDPDRDPCDEPKCPEPDGSDDIARHLERPEDCCPETDEPLQRRPLADGGDDYPDDCPPDRGTDGGDGGSTDGGGRLPKTGAEMATYGLAGLGFVGIGAALKRLGRKKA